MKHLFCTLFLALLATLAQPVFAVDSAQKAADSFTTQTVEQAPLDAQDFLNLSPKEIAKKTGKKLSWGERILLKMTQKKIKKQLAKGIQPANAEGKASGDSKMGVISAILGGVGLLLTFSQVGILVILGLICGIMGLIFGIMGMKRDENKVLAIVGTALSAVVIFIWLLAVIIVASWL